MVLIMLLINCNLFFSSLDAACISSPLIYALCVHQRAAVEVEGWLVISKNSFSLFFSTDIFPVKGCKSYFSKVMY